MHDKTIEPNIRIGIIGLGYVGLPLAIAFSNKYPTTGYDLSETRISMLSKGIDNTKEVDGSDLLNAFSKNNFNITNEIEALNNCNFYIITVPTPINTDKTPDLSYLSSASKNISNILKKGDIVVFESTVYPGAVEEFCVPIIEKFSGLIFNKDFFCGYSPERINPGDKKHTVTEIIKVTSGSDDCTAKTVDRVYKSIINAGTFLAKNIKVAEAAKVIENTQRDLNIALINELSIIFDKIGIDTTDVLDAASTKWNFLDFKPGLVGGHCIGVDPYYLVHKSIHSGYSPEVILAGRKINDGMGKYVSEKVIQIMTKKKIQVIDSRILILGITFKEDCPDTRNSKVIDVIKNFENFNAKVDVFDPEANHQDVMDEYGIELQNNLKENYYDAVVVAVAHKDIKKMSINDLRSICKNNCVIYDIKSIFKKEDVDGRL